MRIILTILMLSVAIFSQEYKYKIKYEIDEKDLFPEGITYSFNTNSFYLGSLYKNKIIKVNASTGEYEDFISKDLIKGYYLGLNVDEKKNVLWACGSEKETSNPFIVKFDLFTGKIIKQYNFNRKNKKMLFNDLIVTKNGDVFFTNSSGQEIYKIDHVKDRIEVFVDDKNIKYPNGIALSDNEKYIYVASGENGLQVIRKKDAGIIKANNNRFNSRGIDGLKFYKNSVIGVQNYVKSKEDRNIRRFHLKDDLCTIDKMEIIDKNNKYFDVPTTFVIVKNKLYSIANSQLLKLGEGNNSIKQGAVLNHIYILEYELN